jgi:hypothetical protein
MLPAGMNMEALITAFKSMQQFNKKNDKMNNFIFFRGLEK